MRQQWGVLKEPLKPADAKRRIIVVMKVGVLRFSKPHALDEMAKDNVVEVDVVNTLRGGICRPAELINGSYRYRFETMTFAAVIAFRSELEAIVVTAWRFKKKR